MKSVVARSGPGAPTSGVIRSPARSDFLASSGAVRDSFAMTRERAVAFVVARLGSKRLAAKHLRRIGDRTLLDWVVGRLAECRELDGVVLATAAEPENLPLVRFAEKRGIECFWYEGDVDHVTTRLRRAAEHANADVCVLVSADCPLVYAPGIDFLVRALRAAPGMDLVGVLDGPEGRRAMLEGCQVARRRAWQRADDLSDTPELARHQFPVMGRREELFRVLATALPDALYAHPLRLSVDTWADLEFMTALHDRLIRRGEPFELPGALALLAAEPELGLINAHVHQRGADEVERRALFVVDPDPRRVEQNRELALQLVERKGVAVTLVVDGETAHAELAARGLSVIWGAFGRKAAQPPRGIVAEPWTGELAGCDLVVLDLDAEPGLAGGWREGLAVGTVAVLCERAREWMGEADLVLDASGIVRREIRRAAREAHKDVDVLVQLRSAEQRGAVERFAERHGLRAVCAAGGSDAAQDGDGAVEDYPAWLARARVLLTDRGACVREALAAGTHPVLWAAREEALGWFEKAGAPPAIVERESDLFLLHGLVSADAPAVRPHDTTGALVERLWKRVLQRGAPELATARERRAKTRR